MTTKRRVDDQRHHVSVPLTAFQRRALEAIEHDRASEYGLGAVEAIAHSMSRLDLTEDERARVERAVARARRRGKGK